MAPADDEGLPPARPLVPEGLGAEATRILAYASAIGREFDFTLLATAMGASEEPLAEQLELLAHRGILRERPGGDRFGFVEDDLRAQIYQSLTASRLRVLHRRIGEALERLVPEPPPELLAELGRHFFLGKVPEKSYRYNRRAADVAREREQPEEAAHHLERARIDLKGLPGDHARDEVELAEELGRLYYSVGEVHAADRLYAEGLERAGTLDPKLRARLLLARAEVARDALDADAARAHARAAHELFSSLGDLDGVAAIHRVLSRVAFHQGAYREALDEAISALDLLQHTNDPRTLGRVSIEIGNAFAMLGPDVQSEAVAWYERAIERLETAEDWPEVARAYLNLASLVGQTRPLDGLDYIARGREFADRAHEPRWAGWGLAMGVDLRLALGQVEEAERDNDQARRLLERVDDPLGLQQVSANLGLISERRGQWEEADAAYRDAIERAQRHHLTAEEAECHYYLARLRFKTRDLAGARAEYARAMEVDLTVLSPRSAKGLKELGRQLADAGPSAGRPAAPGST